ncbi:MAG: T9SS type A sorting domain-containing protein, partial [Bacteroidia bacterium]|nr:T9SS type A sorting domain-containing protein [Bacteroidia bacterium]
PATGVFTQIGNALAGSDIYQGSLNAFDKANHRYIFMSPFRTLITLDAVTGNVVSSPQLQIPTGEVLMGLVFNNSDGQLYGTIVNSTQSNGWVVRIDPQTGTFSGIGPALGFEPNGNAAIDETDGLYMLLHTGNNGFKISTIDISTGQLVSSVNLTNLLPQENACNLAYDNTRRKALAIHWSLSKEEVGINENTIGSDKIFPVPAKDEVKISVPSEPNGAIYLYDLSGRQVSAYETDENGNCVIKKENHAPGLYIVKAMKGGTLAYQGKIIFSEE